MKLFGKFRLNMGNRLLRKKIDTNRRTVSYSNIDNVRNIGVVWDASDPKEFKNISAFYTKMGQRGINVKVIGFCDQKVLPGEFTAIHYFTCLKRDDLNFFFKPLTPESETFIDEKFDVLIDINFKNVFPLRYITSMSRGSIKVGLYREGDSAPFDLMIDQREPTVEEYLEQVIHYLEMINNTTD
jgi:hypothetical protein